MLKTLAALLMLLPWSALAADSVKTQLTYLEHVVTATGIVDDSVMVDVEIPSWATGAFIFANVTNCDACNASLHIKAYQPQAGAQSWLYYYSTGLVANQIYPMVTWPTATQNWAASVFSRRGPLPRGTSLFFVNWVAGELDVDIWVRWVGNPSR